MSNPNRFPIGPRASSEQIVTSPREALTAWQIRSLSNDINLSDGHARDALLGAEIAAIDNAGELLGVDYGVLIQENEEHSFVDAFQRCSGDGPPLGREMNYYFQYSASIGIWVVGAALAQIHAIKVGVLHPSFDNIPLLLRRSGCEVAALHEPYEGEQLDIAADLDAVFLTIPNNPTGWVPDPSEFTRIAQQCAELNVALIVDMTFRFQEVRKLDFYEVLCNVDDLEFAVIEDTGKTWPLNDAKASFLSASPGNLNAAIAEITEEVLLNVSAATLRTLRQAVEASVDLRESNQSPMETRRALALRNMQALKELLIQYGLEIAGSENAFVAWVRLPNNWNAVRFATLAEAAGVSVLPGDAFLWAEEPASPFFRVALLRTGEYFDTGLNLLNKALDSYCSELR